MRAAAYYVPVLTVSGMGEICERDGSFGYGTAMTVFSLVKSSDGRPASDQPRRPHRLPGGAFARNHDGNKIEAVTFQAE